MQLKQFKDLLEKWKVSQEKVDSIDSTIENLIIDYEKRLKESLDYAKVKKENNDLWQKIMTNDTSQATHQYLLNYKKRG